MRSFQLIIVISALIFVRTDRSPGAFERFPNGAAALSMGGASVATEGSYLGGFSNPALFSFLNSLIVSVSYSPSPFGLSELSRGSLHVSAPFIGGFVAASASQAGSDLYKETQIAAFTSWRITEDFSVGCAIRLLHLTISGYGTSWTVGADLGCVVALSTNLSWGCTIYSINDPTIASGEERLPQGIVTGITYQPGNAFRLSCDIAKEVSFPVEGRVGLEYLPHPQLAVRAGGSIQPSAWTGGFGLIIDDIGFDYAFSVHPVLGMTHQIVLLYSPDGDLKCPGV